MSGFNYDDLTIGTILSEKDLESRNRQIHDKSLIAVPTGRVSADGSFEYEIQSIDKGAVNPAQNVDIKSLMGDNVVVTRIPIVALQFVLGINPNNQKAIIVGSSGAVIVGDVGYENRYRVFSGITPGSSIFLSNIKYMNYQAGYEFRFGGTPRWSHLTVPIDVELLVGLFDGNNGYSIGFVDGEDEWGFVRFVSGQPVYVAKSDFNVDKLDGTGLSGFNLNYTLGNIYRIRSLYFGFGPTILEVFDGKRWITAHIVIYPNTEIGTNITETYLPLSVSVKNGAQTTDYYVDIASANVSILIDANARDVNNRVFTESFISEAVGLGDEIPIISFKSKENIQLFGMPTAKENRILADLRTLHLDLKGQNKVGTLLLVITPSDDVTGGNFIDKDADTSVVEVASGINAPTSVDLTNAEVVFERSVATTQEIIDLKALSNELRGLRGTFTASLLYTTQAISTTITGTFGWDERH